MLAKLKQQFLIPSILQLLIKCFLFVLPWQTMWIFQENFFNGYKNQWGTIGFYASEGLLWLFFILFFVWYLIKLRLKIEDLRFKITKDRVFLFICVLFIIYHLSSIFWAGGKSLALQQSVHILETILLFIIIYIGPFDKNKLIKWFVAGAILPSILGIWQFLSQTTFASTWLGLANHPAEEAGTSIISSDSIGRWLRAYGPFAHPNVFGGYLAMVIVLFLILDFRFQNYKRNIIIMAVYCLLLTALFFTFSRSAWLALAIVITYHISHITYQYFVKNNRESVTWHVVCVMCFIILSSIFFPLVKTRFSNQPISEARSIEERVSGYGEAWQLFKLHPLIGVGAGNYTIALHELYPNRNGWDYQPAHNAGLLMLSELGVVGICLFALTLILFFTYHVSRATDQRDLRKWYVLCVVCYVILAVSDHYLNSSYAGLIMSGVFFALILKKDTNLV